MEKSLLKLNQEMQFLSSAQNVIENETYDSIQNFLEDIDKMNPKNKYVVNKSFEFCQFIRSNWKELQKLEDQAMLDIVDDLNTIDSLYNEQYIISRFCSKCIHQELLGLSPEEILRNIFEKGIEIYQASCLFYTICMEELNKYYVAIRSVNEGATPVRFFDINLTKVSTALSEYEKVLTKVSYSNN